jgi:hypothetical protein
MLIKRVYFRELCHLSCTMDMVMNLTLMDITLEIDTATVVWEVMAMAEAWVTVVWEVMATAEAWAGVVWEVMGTAEAWAGVEATMAVWVTGTVGSVDLTEDTTAAALAMEDMEATMEDMVLVWAMVVMDHIDVPSGMAEDMDMVDLGAWEDGTIILAFLLDSVHHSKSAGDIIYYLKSILLKV